MFNGGAGYGRISLSSASVNRCNLSKANAADELPDGEMT